MMGSKGTRAGIRATQAYTVAAMSAFFDRLHLLNYPRLRCLHLFFGRTRTPSKVRVSRVMAKFHYTLLVAELQQAGIWPII